MSRCDFTCIVESFNKWDKLQIQCVNEGGHVGDHLIIVPR